MSLLPIYAMRSFVLCLTYVQASSVDFIYAWYERFLKINWEDNNWLNNIQTITSRQLDSMTLGCKLNTCRTYKLVENNKKKKKGIRQCSLELGSD